jgi:copper chaperone
MEKKTLKVEGMSCDHCAKAVTKALSDLSGVTKVKVDLKTASVSFTFNPAKVCLKEIEAAIIDAGFTVAV